jgi:carbon-monoxide dehydrogenase small subunit
MSEHQVQLTVNGQTVSTTVEARLTLADFLRDNLGYTGVHLGCEHGVCGACTVMIDGQAMRSCLQLAVQADGAEIVTVEGLARPDGALHPVQQAMRESHALQCGFCTPGVVMTLVSLTADDETPDAETLIRAMSGHLCRCTGYQGIRRAINRMAGVQTIGEHE